MFSWPASCCRLPLYQKSSSSSTRAPLSTDTAPSAPAALSRSRPSPPAGASRGEPAESAWLTRLAVRTSGVVNDSSRSRPRGAGDGRAPPPPEAPAPPGGGDVSGLDDGFSRRDRRGESGSAMLVYKPAQPRLASSFSAAAAGARRAVAGQHDHAYNRTPGTLWLLAGWPKALRLSSVAAILTELSAK